MQLMVQLHHLHLVFLNVTKLKKYIVTKHSKSSNLNLGIPDDSSVSFV